MEAKWDLQDLLKKAQEYCDCFEWELALRFCSRALEKDPECLEGLQIMSSILIEIGRPEEAIELLQRCVCIAPEDGYEKYMALGQLHSGEESLEYYQKAALILEDRLHSESAANLTTDLSSIYCCLAELYLTDLCFAEDAENICQGFIQRAKECSENGNPEALRLEAEVRLAQDRREEAVEAMRECIRLLRLLSPEADAQRYPGYEQRSAMARVLVETGLFDEAMEVLEALLAEDDEVVETWYLLGILLKMVGSERDNAIEAFKTAIHLMKASGEEDEDLVSSINGFLSELGAENVVEDQEE